MLGLGLADTNLYTNPNRNRNPNPNPNPNPNQVAQGSSTQIALFVVPVMVLLGWLIDQPLDLIFGTFETVIT